MAGFTIEKAASGLGIAAAIAVVILRFGALEESRAQTDRALNHLTEEHSRTNERIDSVKIELLERLHQLDLKLARIESESVFRR